MTYLAYESGSVGACSRMISLLSLKVDPDLNDPGQILVFTKPANKSSVYNLDLKLPFFPQLK